MIDQVLEAIGLKHNDEEAAVEKDYDDFQRPPNLEIARRHANASKFALTNPNIDLDNTNVCPCCGMPTVIEELPLCSNRKDFSFNGSGIALYFDFLVYSTIMVGIYVAVAGIYNILDDSNGDRCIMENQTQNQFCSENFYNKYSRSNVSKSVDVYGSILNFVASIVIMITTLYYRRHINHIAQELDDACILASDYSIFIENIPRDATADEIKSYFSKEIDGNEVEIRKVCMGYEIQSYIDLDLEKQTKESILTRILELEAKGRKIPASIPKRSILEQQIKEVSERLDYLEEHLDENFAFSGCAVISYNREKQADYVCDAHQANRNDLLLEKFGVSYNASPKFRGNNIVVTRAAEPGDIIWGNLGIDVWEQQKRIIKTNLMTVLLLAIGFGLIFGLSYAQFEIGKAMDESSLAALALITVLGFLASILITVINAVLAKIIIKFAELEKHPTKTQYDISVAQKLGIAQFLNTAIITLIVNIVIVEKGEVFIVSIWKNGGLNADLMLIFITNSILPWVMQIVDPNYFYKLYVRAKILLEGDQCKYTQREANKAFQGPSIDLSKKYAILCKTLLFAFFYSYLLPLGMVFTLLSFVCTYWTEKILLLKRDSKPPPTGSAMAKAMIEFYIELILVLNAIGCLIWEYSVFGEVHPITWAQFGVSFLYYVLPEERVCGFIIQTGVDNATVESYDEKYLTFYDDYDRQNPVTKDAAMAAWKKIQQDTVVVPSPTQDKLLRAPGLASMSKLTTGSTSKVHPQAPEHLGRIQEIKE